MAVHHSRGHRRAKLQRSPLRGQEWSGGRKREKEEEEEDREIHNPMYVMQQEFDFKIREYFFLGLVYFI